MKKLQLSILLILILILGLRFFVQKETIKQDEQIAGEKVVDTGKVTMTFLDIGQGDATFIEFPDGQQMLVDCAIDGRILEALGRVMPYYDRDIDYLLITHQDLDHFGGCEEVLSRFEVKHIVYSGSQDKSNEMWQSFWEAKNREGAKYEEIQAEDVWTIASTSIHFFYPDHAIVESNKIPGFEDEVNANNMSLVFRLDYGENSVLMMADAEKELEIYLLETYGDQLDVDILKLGHHGSDSSSIQEFIDMVSPEQAIASSGIGNKYGHPSRRVIKRVERASSTMWRTDLQGDILLEMDNEGYEIGMKD
ncbi:MAG: MBL fold metallo-hydrolase [Candidatus Magasanikbacteria bacterium]|nr:MBL fold metallo-hydrolase [Candidatus Magasanikbacteria bacterium]